MLGPEHSEKARASHTHEPSDVAKCGALILLQKPPQYREIQQKSCSAFMQWALAQLLPAPAFRFTRYFARATKPLPAVVLVVRRRHMAVVPRPMPTAPRKYLIVLPRPLRAAPLLERRRSLALESRRIPAVPRRYLNAVPRLMRTAPRRYLAVVPGPQPAASLVVRRRYLIVAPGRFLRRRSLCVALT